MAKESAYGRVFQHVNTAVVAGLITLDSTAFAQMLSEKLTSADKDGRIGSLLGALGIQFVIWGTAKLAETLTGGYHEVPPASTPHQELPLPNSSFGDHLKDGPAVEADGMTTTFPSLTVPSSRRA